MFRLLCALVFCSLPVLAQLRPSNPHIAEIVEAVSEERIAATLRRLEQFETRNAFSATDHETRGTGAARRWLERELRSYSPRLRVRRDLYPLKKMENTRIFRDVDVVNIIAELPGKTHPDRQIIVSAHYDSVNQVLQPRSPDLPQGDSPELDHEKTVAARAPGVTDNGSGVAAVLELARIMSAREWDNTIVFALFDAEEYGLVGSTMHAEEAKKKGIKIEAVLNNDIIGSEVDGRGRSDTLTIRVFSSEPADSGSRQLARYIRDIAARHTPAVRAEPVFQPDRFARGGDHTPFHERGFAAVRFTTANEHYANQHTDTDTFANTSPRYTTMVARVNAAVAASLALAPPIPVVTRIATTGASKGKAVPNISRGATPKGYDARLRWADSGAPDLAGYIVLSRSTTAPFWEREIFVGKVTEYTLKDVSIDDRVFGVKAVDTEGNESMAAAYVIPTQVRPVYELRTAPQPVASDTKR